MSRTVIFALSALGIVACSSSNSETDEPVTEGAVEAQGIHAEPGDSCKATLVFLQKDAYKSTAGRSSPYWPPHTTTVLDVICKTANGDEHIAPFQDNYGTAPGEKDKDGKEILVLVEMDPKVNTLEAPWAKMKELVSSYESCGCDPSGFLSLDKVKAEGKEILDEVLPLLSCPDGTDPIVQAVSEKKFEDAGRMIAKCRIQEGTSAGDIVAKIASIESKVKTTLETHHVCNNNAQLQVDLFTRFRDRKDASSCEAHRKDFCFGPKLWYSPAKEVK